MEALTRSRYHQGVNSVSVHWNYILIKIKKSTLNNIKNGSIGAAGYLAGKFKNIYVAIAASAIVGVLSANSIKGGGGNENQQSNVDYHHRNPIICRTPSADISRLQC